MDSGDEVSGVASEVCQASAATRSSSEERELQAPLPTSYADVETLSQLLRMAPALQEKARRMSLGDLAAACEAAARVRFYDAAVFGAVKAAVRGHLRGRGSFQAGHIASIVTSLAELNAYDRELFSAAARTLEHGTGLLEGLSRRRILDAFRKVKHDSDQEFLSNLGRQEKAARYEAACEEVATSWQRPGVALASRGGFRS